MPRCGPRERGERAHFLNNRGTVLAAEHRLGLARHDFEQALGLGAGNDACWVLLDLTEVSLEAGDVERAELYLKQARARLEPGKEPPPSVFYYRSWVDQARGHLAEAAADLAPVPRANLSPEWGWKIAYQEGRVAEVRGDLRAAEAAYGRSIAVLEEMRRGLSFDELKAWLLEEQRRPFEALFRLQARSGRAEESLATAERALARTFLRRVPAHHLRPRRIDAGRQGLVAGRLRRAHGGPGVVAAGDERVAGGGPATDRPRPERLARPRRSPLFRGRRRALADHRAGTTAWGSEAGGADFRGPGSGGPLPGPSGRRSRSRLLADCLSSLAPRARDTVLLRFQQGLSYPEIARLSDEKAPALQIRVARALPLLRRCLEEKGVAP